MCQGNIYLYFHKSEIFPHHLELRKASFFLIQNVVELTTKIQVFWKTFWSKQFNIATYITKWLQYTFCIYQKFLPTSITQSFWGQQQQWEFMMTNTEQKSFFVKSITKGKIDLLQLEEKGGNW